MGLNLFFIKVSAAPAGALGLGDQRLIPVWEQPLCF